MSPTPPRVVILEYTTSPLLSSDGSCFFGIVPLMAVLKNMPEASIIDGFKGKIDFYEHRGQVCVRKWPRSPGHKRAPAVEAQWSVFAAAVSGWSSLPDYIRSDYRRWASPSTLSGRDLFIKGYISGIYRYPKELCMLPQAYAYMCAQMNNLISGTEYKLVLDSEEYDIGGNFDTVNYRFIAPRDGRYLVIANVGWFNLNANNDRYIFIKRNGSEVITSIKRNVSAGNWTHTAAGIIQLLATQYLELSAKHFCGINTVDITNMKHWTNFFVSLLE